MPIYTWSKSSKWLGRRGRGPSFLRTPGWGIIIRLLYCIYNSLMSLIRIELAGVKRLRRKSSWWSNINPSILSISLRNIVLIKRYILIIFSIIILAHFLWGTVFCTVWVYYWLTCWSLDRFNVGSELRYRMRPSVCRLCRIRISSFPSLFWSNFLKKFNIFVRHNRLTGYFKVTGEETIDG